MEEEAPGWPIEDEDEEENAISVLDKHPPRKASRKSKFNTRLATETAIWNAATAAIGVMLMGNSWQSALIGAGVTAVASIGRELLKATDMGADNEE